ncbi:MAG: flagellar basal-body MS-ring/collar protein FliF [Bacillota bacterium]|jgi:flagellar M-ring protein FliF|nr:flagellar basal-body MS-ring/collar protein FliF [Bacillota bacterium]
MQGWLKQKEAIFNFWSRLTINQKVLFSSGILLIAIISVFLITQAGKPDFVPLYTNLDPQDAAAVTEYLKEKKIPYQLSNEGSTILVPASQKYQLRLDLANEGLPKGGSVGFESFNQTRFGETESERRIKYLVALQGELERTIRKLEVVEDVRIHIVIPEPSLFIEKEKDASASVLLKLKPGRSLKNHQIAGIMHLVASGVEGLKPENVTVVDTQGNILSEVLDDIEELPSTTRLTANQLQVVRDYEEKLEKSIQSMLERIVGQGKAVVRANASLDFDRVEIRKEDFGDKAVRSQQTKEETSSGNLTPEGEPGPGSNIPTYEQLEGQGTSQHQKTEKITNYELDRQEEYRVIAPGQIKQLSVSVVVDGQLDLQQQREIEGLVTAAAGIRPERGDTLTVTSMPFNTAWARQLEKEMSAARSREQIATYGLIAGVLVGVLILLSWLLRRRRPQAEIDYLAGTQRTVGEILATQEPELTEEEKERLRIFEQIQRLVRQSPKDVAQLLKTWLTEESR